MGISSPFEPWEILPRDAEDDRVTEEMAASRRRPIRLAKAKMRLREIPWDTCWFSHS
jgi:hypothetical protein